MNQISLPIARARGVIEPWDRAPDGSWTLVKGDCREVMAKIPDRSIDLVFADSPYFLSNGGTACKGGQRVEVGKGAWDESQGVAVDHIFHLQWLEQVREILKPTGTCWISATHHALFSIGFAMQKLGFHVLNLVTWAKPNAAPNLACRMFTHSTEHLIWASPFESAPLAHTFNYGDMKAATGKQMRDFWNMPTTPASEKIHGHHPCQKPEGLLDRIILASSRPGDLILDPFVGSGTSVVVARTLGRRAIGIDMDPQWLELTRRRLAAKGK